MKKKFDTPAYTLYAKARGEGDGVSIYTKGGATCGDRPPFASFI